jgi:hypothetical protein
LPISNYTFVTIKQIFETGTPSHRRCVRALEKHLKRKLQAANGLTFSQWSEITVGDGSLALSDYDLMRILYVHNRYRWGSIVKKLLSHFSQNNERLAFLELTDKLVQLQICSQDNVSITASLYPFYNLPKDLDLRSFILNS